MTKQKIVVAAFSAAVLVGAASAANAAVISTVSGATLSSTPLTISLGSGAAGFSFTSVTTGYGPGAAVATTGNGMVSNIFGGVADFVAGATIDQTGELYTFASSPNASTIPFSAADDFIGLSFMLSDGTHYGYAEVFGASLVGYGYETVANTTILTGATTSAVPEPASAALLLAGLGMVGLVAWRRNGRIGQSPSLS